MSKDGVISYSFADVKLLQMSNYVLFLHLCLEIISVHLKLYGSLAYDTIVARLYRVSLLLMMESSS